MLHRFEGLQISDIAAVVPSNTEGAADWQALFHEGWNAQLIEQTGIRSLGKSRLSTLYLGLAACGVLYPNCALSNNVKIKSHVSINLSCSIGHDAVIGEFSVLSSHCDVTGGVIIGDAVMLGSRVSIIPRV